jgi:hypothetical protein
MQSYIEEAGLSQHERKKVRIKTVSKLSYLLYLRNTSLVSAAAN